MASTNRSAAVLGGGLQGCCVALALAGRGLRVTLYDRNAALLSRAAVANEGKIHLGYVFCGDESLATARILARGAIAFAPLLARYLGAAPPFCASTPFLYLVHRDSMKPVAHVAAYLAACHAAVRDAAAGRADGYFGIDLRDPPRALASAEREAAFDPRRIAAAFATPEIAVHPPLLAAALRTRIAAEPRIELRTGRAVVAVEDEATRLSVVSDGPDGADRRSYDHVVNALWDGRHAIDAGRGAAPARPWLYRFKHGIRFRPPAGTPPLPSVTIVNGPFGDIVSYADGTVYLSWYPACLQGVSMELTPPDWPAVPAPALRNRLVADSLAALAGIVPALGALDPDDLPGLAVAGGVIVAWGETDIDDPGSLLHQRYGIGVWSEGRYHSVDPGKYTMAPYFAAVCADRIAGG